MADTYLSLTVDLPETSAELLQSLLHDCGALGLEVRDSEAPPMPGVRGPQAGEAIVIGFFDQKTDRKSKLRPYLKYINNYLFPFLFLEILLGIAF